MQNPLLFLLMPRIIFEDLKSKPRWIVPFILVVIGLITINWLGSCWRAQSLTFNIRILAMVSISMTILILLSWLFISTFLYWAIAVIKTDAVTSYKMIFSVITYCGVIFLLGEITNSLLIHARLIDSMQYTLPDRFPLGLDILVLGKTPHPVWAILLYSINPFTIWYMAVLSIGLSTAIGLSKTKAIILSFMVCFIVVGFVVGVLVITGGTKISIRIGM
jgi:hypothetical protein